MPQAAVVRSLRSADPSATSGALDKNRHLCQLSSPPFTPLLIRSTSSTDPIHHHHRGRRNQGFDHSIHLLHLPFTTSPLSRSDPPPPNERGPDRLSRLLRAIDKDLTHQFEDVDKYKLSHSSKFQYLNQRKKYELDGVSHEYLKIRRAMDDVGSNILQFVFHSSRKHRTLLEKSMLRQFILNSLLL